jgi:hypothetical protein
MNVGTDKHKSAGAQAGSHLAGSIYGGSAESGVSSPVPDVISATDRALIRELARRWRDLAALPVMADRKRQWTAVHDLRMERPMILVETSSIQGFVDACELQCRNPLLRAVERNMRDTVRHAEEVGDDVVVEPYYRIGWQMNLPGFGVPVEMIPATTMTGETSLGYTFNFPIATPEDTAKLQDRTFGVNRERTLQMKAALEGVMGDLLPVLVGNYDPFLAEPGDEGWTGMFFFGLTWQIYRFVGNNGLMCWPCEAPEAIPKLMQYMLDDRLRLFEFMERENLLVANTDNQMAGPRAYGYVSELPGPDPAGSVALKQIWGWAESQESTMLSPLMFKEFILPYLAKLSERFGLIYYGCCEPVHDRLDLIMEAIPNLRSVSVSGWADFQKIGDMLGRNYVYSRKPTPAFLSGRNPQWESVESDMKKTRAATKNCNVEILFRDLYTIDADHLRLRKWVEMTRSIFGI